MSGKCQRQSTPKTAAGPGVSYAYDTLDRLTDVYYGSAYTNFSYDYAGRKRGTIDADMGTWYYSYDASSNLTGQTDARGCVTTIGYDLLNRPTGKSYSGSCGVTTTSVTYSYDSYSPANAQWGRGQRTGMTDGSGSTSWMYDPRGRLRRESKTITGSGTFITEWSYNSADLVDWMKYPGGNGVQGEQVNFTYVPQMLVKTAVGYTTYVKNATYDAAGRSDILNLGLNPDTSNAIMYLDYNYYAWDVQGGRLQWLQAVQTGSLALLRSWSTPMMPRATWTGSRITWQASPTNCRTTPTI